MTYTLWDKQSPIYDVTADQAINNNPLYGSENSYLFLNDDDGSINDILPISTLRRLTESADTATDAEVCEAYITKIITPKPTQEDEITELKTKNTQLEAKVKALSESNQFLEDCIVEMAEIVYA